METRNERKSGLTITGIEDVESPVLVLSGRNVTIELDENGEAVPPAIYDAEGVRVNEGDIFGMIEEHDQSSRRFGRVTGITARGVEVRWIHWADGPVYVDAETFEHWSRIEIDERPKPPAPLPGEEISMSKRPKRITIASVRAILRRYGCTVEEGFREFLVDPPAGMGFDLGDLSQRVFCYAEEVPASDPDSRRSILEEIYDGAGAMAACLEPWRVDGDYAAAIEDVLRDRFGEELAGVDLRHVEAWLRDADAEISALDPEEFQAAVVAAYHLAISRAPSVSEARARELGL